MVKISRITVAVAAILYLITIVTGFLLFGPNTALNVLVNFGADFASGQYTAVNTVMRVFYALHIILVFPVTFYPLRVTVDDLLFPNAPQLLVDTRRRFYLLTGSLLVLILIPGIFIPNVWVAFNIVGSPATMAVAFIFPALVALKSVPLFPSA